jgi:hypothetical protein
VYVKELPFGEGVSEYYEKATIDTYLTEEEMTKLDDELFDIYPRFDHRQEQRRADDFCELVHHTVQCFVSKSSSPVNNNHLSD